MKSNQIVSLQQQLPDQNNEAFHGTMEDILNLPYEPAKDSLKNILDLPPLSDKDYDEDSGDDDHMDNFISLSDDEETVKQKQAQKEYNFRQRVSDKKEKKKLVRGKKPYEKSQ